MSDARVDVAERACERHVLEPGEDREATRRDVRLRAHGEARADERIVSARRIERARIENRFHLAERAPIRAFPIVQGARSRFEPVAFGDREFDVSCDRVGAFERDEGSRDPKPIDDGVGIGRCDRADRSARRESAIDREIECDPTRRPDVGGIGRQRAGDEENA